MNSNRRFSLALVFDILTSGNPLVMYVLRVVQFVNLIKTRNLSKDLCSIIKFFEVCEII
jgi:hypothetical protein